MRIRTAILATATVALAVQASALVRPGHSSLPDFDVRSTIKGVAMGAAPGQFRARLGGTVGDQMSAAQRDSLARLEERAGGDVVVRRSTLTGAPKALFRYEGPLTGPDWRDPAVIASTFLVDYGELLGLANDGREALTESRRFTSRGGELTILHLEQQRAGMSVFHGEVRFVITAAGEIASVTSGVPVPTFSGIIMTAGIDASTAVGHAAREVGVELQAPLTRLNPVAEKLARFEQGPFMHEVTLEPTLFPLGASARLAYKVMIARADTPDQYEVVVDAENGELLHRYNMTKYVETRGLTFWEHPIADPGGVPIFRDWPDPMVRPDARIPFGWVDESRSPAESFGNVVDSHEDIDGDNVPGARSFDFDPSRPPIQFEDPWTNSYETTGDPAPDRFFSITQGFFWANTYHDWLYDYGFDEASGNWQHDNFARGGRGGDRLNVDIHDGWNTGARNNANMATPPDGGSPRAQFFLFTPALGARRDSAVDGDIVIHEFTHGLSNRLIGGGSSASCLVGFQGGSMGEGWSDYYALNFYDEPRLGEYGTGNLFSGIRSDPYNAYPTCHTFNAAMGGVGFCVPNSCAGICQPPFCPTDCEVHDEGQLWAATLWEMTALLEQEYMDRAMALDISLTLVTDGMKLTGCSPTFLDARDGILLADRYVYGGAHQCLIWEAFADRWMGWSATTSGVDDLVPAGLDDDPPFCLTDGDVVLDLDSYSCQDALTVTVHDGNVAAASVQVRLTTTSGDVETVDITGSGPSWVSSPITVTTGGFTMENGTLEGAAGDTITAEYVDTNPAIMAMTSAPMSCLADLGYEWTISGGCSPDGATWPGDIPQILDAGEVVDFQLILRNDEPREMTNVVVSVTSLSPEIAVIQPAAPIPAIPAFTGAGTATIQLSASAFAMAGSTATIDFDVTADGFTGLATPISIEIPIQSDYMVVSTSTGVEDFEADDGGYVRTDWPGTPSPGQWMWGTLCGAASGNNAWYAADPSDCDAGAANQDSNVEPGVPFTPITATRLAWYPTGINFNHRMQIASTDQMVFALTEPGYIDAGGDISFDAVAFLDSSLNTGGAFAPISINWPASATLGAGLEVDKGLVWWFDFFTTSGAGVSDHWAVDDIELFFDAADAVPQAGGASCVEGGYVGDVSGCAGAFDQFVYNTAQPSEAQYGGDGRFFTVVPDWHLFDMEFPTPTAPGDDLVFVASQNPDDGAHQGVMAVNGERVTDPAFHDFGTAFCADIPTPAGPAATVAEGQPIQLSWPAFAESGPVPAIIGYDIYRLDAETFPPATSTIDDYLAAGPPVGTTVGQALINEYIDTAPPVATGSFDEFTYVIQPVLACDGCAMPAGLTFNGSEAMAGKANVSTDSNVVRVSIPLLASFVSYGAERNGRDVVIEWQTSKETGTIGYEVWRGTTADEDQLSKVSSVIFAEGPYTPYEYVDEGAPTTRLYYQVRELAASGAGTTRTEVFALAEPPGRSGGANGGRGRSRGGSRSLRGADDGAEAAGESRRRSRSR